MYLLDDPLSAVDTHVGKQLFDDCINGYLKQKTVVLVTHQVQYLKDADIILVLDNVSINLERSDDLVFTLLWFFGEKGAKSVFLVSSLTNQGNIFPSQGKVASQGSFQELQKSNATFANLLEEGDNEEEGEKSPEKITLERVVSAISNAAEEEEDEDDPQETEELLAKGGYNSSLYWKYFRAGGSKFMIILVVVSLIVGQLASSGTDYWVAYW